jgi:PAS domain S-box-containing protein
MNNHGRGVVDQIVDSNMRPYLIATLLVIALTSIRILLTPLLSLESPFLLFTIAVLISGLIGGLGPGLWATFLAAASANFFILEPAYSFKLLTLSNGLALILFCIVGLIISLLCELRKRDIAGLQKSHNNTLMILESITDCFCSLDKDWRFTYLNNNAEKYIGRRREELIGRNIWHLFPSALNSPYFEKYNEAVSKNLAVHFESPSTIDSRWAEVHAYPTEEGLSVYFRDITSRKRAEQEKEEAYALEQKSRREAEAAIQMKDQFLTTITHDLRAPLTAILSWAYYLKKSELNHERFNEAINGIINCTKTQSKLVEDLVDVSRIKTGDLRIEETELEVSSFINPLIEAIRLTAEAKGLKIELRNNDGSYWVRGDCYRLQQVFWNLLSNAIKFTPRGGNIFCSVNIFDSEVEIEVKDDGEGIGPDLLPHVFEAFRKGSRNPDPGQDGLGLGLAITKHIVELHKGTVSAASDGPGKGSTFKIRLPAYLPAASSQNLSKTATAV